MKPYEQLSRSISGHKALITGAASGMGRATAHLFASEGATVAVTDLDQAKCDAVVAEIEAADYPGSARGWALDVTDEAAITRVVGEVAESFGGLDILVNNAGFSLHGTIEEDHYPDAWSKSL